MTVPPALVSHESTEHYTPQYIIDAVIACMGAINLDPCSNSREIPLSAPLAGSAGIGVMMQRLNSALSSGIPLDTGCSHEHQRLTE